MELGTRVFPQVCFEMFMMLTWIILWALTTQAKFSRVLDAKITECKTIKYLYHRIMVIIPLGNGHYSLG